jgi:hypothetical protein
MTRDPAQELYTLLEREVRTPREKLPLDAFLPAAEAILSAIARPVAAPPPPDAPEPAPGAALRQILGAPASGEEMPAEPPAPPRRRRNAPVNEREKSLEEEVAEFMSRSSRALAPDPEQQ